MEKEGYGRMSGYLTKQGDTIKLWKKRWFNLDEDHIYYYKYKGDIDYNGQFQLDSTSKCEPYAFSKIGRYRFFVETPNRVYHMYCDTEEGMKQWVDRINMAINNLK